MDTSLLVGSIALPVAVVAIWFAARAGARDAERDMEPLARLAAEAERLVRGESR